MVEELEAELHQKIEEAAKKDNNEHKKLRSLICKESLMTYVQVLLPAATNADLADVDPRAVQLDRRKTHFVTAEKRLFELV